ncbi:MAG: alpha-L-rhamnosidase N-terminal domain-containing protein, partial [Caldilineaceae bacterium]|nr:alpha-L-rhamnosidase N-terminal domain-containing protein [Caldilineaceae bacterium]
MSINQNQRHLTMVTLHALTCEHFPNPLGIDTPQPRLSWQLQSDRRGARQSAYLVQVTSNGATLWDSEKVSSAQSLHIPYAGPALQPGQRCAWRVRVWDENDEPSAWSTTASWEMGLLDPANWQADWITPDWDEDTTQPQPAPMLRTEFMLDGEIAEARLYATSLGLYELHLNGHRVGDGQLTPGWTSYQQRVQYQTYDVTHLLQAGDNALGALLGDGWYRGYLGFQNQRNLYGDQLALLCQLTVTYRNGRTQTITSNDAWKATTGPLRMTDLYWGEEYDARLEKPGLAIAGYDDRDWAGARVLDHAKSIVVAQRGPFVKRQEELRPQRIFQSPKGETILDFGQNMV